MQNLAVAMVAMLAGCGHAQITFADMTQYGSHADPYTDHGPGDYHDAGEWYGYYGQPHHYPMGEAYPHLGRGYHPGNPHHVRGGHAISLHHGGSRGIDVDPFLGETPYRTDSGDMPIDVHFREAEHPELGSYHPLADKEHHPDLYFGFKDPTMVPPRHHQFDSPTMFRTPTHQDEFHAHGDHYGAEHYPFHGSRHGPHHGAHGPHHRGHGRHSLPHLPSHVHSYPLEHLSEIDDEEQMSNQEPPVNFFMDPYHSSRRHGNATGEEESQLDARGEAGPGTGGEP